MSWTKVAKPTNSVWTNVSKPSGGGKEILAGYATGIIGPPTYSKKYVVGSPWTFVNKPETSSWTNVSKPTS